MKYTLKEIVKGTTAKISHICNGIIYYNIDVGDDTTYQLGIDCTDMSEWKNTYLYTEFKAITLMRWIRKSIENGTLVEMDKKIN